MTKSEKALMTSNIVLLPGEGGVRGGLNRQCDIIDTHPQSLPHKGGKSTQNPSPRPQSMPNPEKVLAAPAVLAKSKKAAFTLAEVLITLLIIGVVAALTLPTLIMITGERVKQNQIKVVTQKVAKSASLLSVQNGIGPYYSTSKEFFEELSKYLKINKICEPSKLRECIPYDSVIKSNGIRKSLSEYGTENGVGVKMIDTEDHRYGEVVGIVLGDGTPMVLSYDLKCPIVDPDSRNDNPTSCIHGWYDINGAKGPNQWTKDIVGFNFGYGDAFASSTIPRISGNGAECRNMQKKGLIKDCHGRSNTDYYASVVKVCGGEANIPTMEDLAALASVMYTTDSGAVTIGLREYVVDSNWEGDLTTKTVYSGFELKYNLIKIKGNGFGIWSTQSAGSNMYKLYRYFGPNTTRTSYDTRIYAYVYGLCKGVD